MKYRAKQKLRMTLGMRNLDEQKPQRFHKGNNKDNDVIHMESAKEIAKLGENPVSLRVRIYIQMIKIHEKEDERKKRTNQRTNGKSRNSKILVTIWKRTAHVTLFLRALAFDSFSHRFLVYQTH